MNKNKNVNPFDSVSLNGNTVLYVLAGDQVFLAELGDVERDYQTALAQCQDSVSPDSATELIRASFVEPKVVPMIVHRMRLPANERQEIRMSSTVDEQPASRGTEYRNSDTPHPYAGHTHVETIAGLARDSLVLTSLPAQLEKRLGAALVDWMNFCGEASALAERQYLTINDAIKLTWREGATEDGEDGEDDVELDTQRVKQDA